MRILLDECIDEGLRHSFPDHRCETCRYAGLKGLANGRLLAAADSAGFDVLVTVDGNMPHQQNLEGRHIAIVVLQARSTNFEDLVVLIPEVLRALEALKAGQVTRIGSH